MKIAFITSGSLLHCDENIIPHLIGYYTIGWFPYFIGNDSLEKLSDIIKISSSNNIYFSYIKSPHRYRSFYTFYMFYKHIRYVKKWEPDIVYINGGAFPWLPLLCSLFFPRNKMIWALHDVIPHSSANKREYISSFFIQSIFKNYHLLSHNQYTIFCKRKHNKNAYFAPHPLCDYGNRYADKSIFDNTKIHFLFFGRIEGYKGIDLLIHAAEYARSIIGNRFDIIIAGNGDFNKYRSIIRNQDIFIIKNYRIPDSEIASLFFNAHYLVLPYSDATQSGPMHIALNYGVPVLASDIDAFDYFSKKFSSVIQIPRTVEDWGKEIIKRCQITYKHENIDTTAYKSEIIEAYINMFNDVYNST
jgi:glycosyltransferase involved in cell wall biosynthesis